MEAKGLKPWLPEIEKDSRANKHLIGGEKARGKFSALRRKDEKTNLFNINSFIILLMRN